MYRYIILVVAALFVSGVSAQVHLGPTPQQNFHKTFTDSLQIKGPFGLGVPKLNAPKGILESNPFAIREPSATARLRPAMPILHPELDGYQMPVITPAQDVAHSLLILPGDPSRKVIPPAEE